MRGVLLGRLVADPGMQPAATLTRVDHAVPVRARRGVRPGRERRRALLDRQIGPEEPEGVGVHGECADVLLRESPREPLDDGVAAARDLAVLILDLGVGREQVPDRLGVLRVVRLDERGEQVGDGPDVGFPLL